MEYENVTNLIDNKIADAVAKLYNERITNVSESS